MNGQVEYRDEHIDSHNGQHDYELGLYIDDEIIGMVQYTLYNGDLTVRNIVVRPEFRRQGYGSKMMKHIKQQHPDYKYTPSMKTDLGSKFVHKDVNLQEIRKIIREVLEEEVIEETHVAQKDLEKFVKNILFFMGKRCIDEFNRQKEYTNEPSLTDIPILVTGRMRGGEYDEISDFVDSTSIKIHPVEIIDNDLKVNGRLFYVPALENLPARYEIKLRYSRDAVEEINEMLVSDNNGLGVDYKDVYFKLYYMFFSVLLHEIQHAYDAWRSGGKAFNSQFTKEYIKKQELVKSLSNKDVSDLSPEEIDAINNSSKAYLNLVHEINARYAQAMHKVRLKGLDDNFNDIIKPWKNVYSDFKTHFVGWQILSDEMKKKLTRRLAKAYNEESNDLKTSEEKYGKESVAENYIRSIVREIIKEEFGGKRIVAGVLIKCISTDNIFLLLRNDPKPIWALVSGTIDSGENVLSGLKRELYEELFVNPSSIDFKFVRVENIPEKNIEFHYYEGYVEKEFTPILDEENLDGRWFPINMIPSPLYKGMPEKIEKIYNSPEFVEDSKPEELIGEAALRIKDLPNTAALFVRPINQGHDLTIYDPTTKDVYGTITVSQRDYYGPDYFVSGVAAERGFGPLIYELAMMHISGEGKGLMPTRDGDVRSDAWRVWEKFYDRNDIKKKTLSPDSPYFKFDIIFSEDDFESDEERQEWLEEVDPKDLRKLYIFNTVYYFDKNSEYTDLINRGVNYINKGFDEQKAVDAAEDFWNEKY